MYYDLEDFAASWEIYKWIAKFNKRNLHDFIFDEEEKFLRSKSSHSAGTVIPYMWDFLAHKTILKNYILFVLLAGFW